MADEMAAKSAGLNGVATNKGDFPADLQLNAVKLNLKGAADANGVYCPDEDPASKDDQEIIVGQEKPDTADRTSPWKLMLRLLICALAGFVFGWAMEKSRVFEPASIRGQMVFRRWIMLKMFLAALATGQLCFILLSLVPQFRPHFDAAFDAFGGCFNDKGIVSSGVGAFALGAGMTLSGACPGMVLAQVGSWTKNSVFTLIGALIGSLLYSLVSSYVIQWTKPKKPFAHRSLHEALKLKYVFLAAPMVAVLALVVTLMEVFIPWKNDLLPESRQFYGSIFQWKAWPPFAGGILIGSLQLVIVFAVSDTLGGSSSYVTLVSQWVVHPKVQKLFPYLARARCGIGNWWQVFYVCGAVLGSMTSSFLSSSFSRTKGVTIPCAIGGGVLMLLGARFAAGCTSGHGLSGSGMLFLLSFIAVPCMFAGAIATGFAMQATGALDDYDCFSHVNYTAVNGTCMVT